MKHINNLLAISRFRNKTSLLASEITLGINVLGDCPLTRLAQDTAGSSLIELKAELTDVVDKRSYREELLRV